MSKAIGMVEYKTVSAGVVAADAMVKTSEVSIIEAQTVCPGKYIVIISGDLSAVNAAVETSKALHGKHLINSFVLGNRTNPFSRQSMGLLRSKMYLLSELWRLTMPPQSLWLQMRLRRQRLSI